MVQKLAGCDMCSEFALGYLERRKTILKLSLVLDLCVFSPLTLVSELNGSSFSLNSLCISASLQATAPHTF